LAASGGFVAGSAVSYLAIENLPELEAGNIPASGQQSNILPTDEPVILREAPISSLVNDEMTFDEAFATARQEVGAGGVFLWKDHAYNTYYAEEWNAMSDDQKHDYMASLNYPEPSSKQEDALTDTIKPEPSPLPDTETEDTTGDENQQAATEEPDYMQPIVNESGEQIPVDPDYSNEETLQPEVIDIEFDEAGNAIIAVDITNDEQFDAVMLDINADGILDVVAIDLDHDGIPDEAPASIEEYGITVDQVKEEFLENESDITSYASRADNDAMSDFIDDADISTL
ncbi:MAG: hypothetical protein JXA23_12575, partial [Bacteroidales bacterium]|nr:hypothetical protein [Bacteroidales bacterium]